MAPKCVYVNINAFIFQVGVVHSQSSWAWLQALHCHSRESKHIIYHCCSILSSVFMKEIWCGRSEILNPQNIGWSSIVSICTNPFYSLGVE